jgi:hypothetical protein
MTQAFFLAILLLAFIAFALMWLLGLHIKFELTFKTLATVLVMLPLLVIPTLLVFVIGFGLYMLVSGALYSTGLLSSIPDRYVIWSLGVMWVRYIVLVVRNEQGRPAHRRKRAARRVPRMSGTEALVFQINDLRNGLIRA